MEKRYILDTLERMNWNRSRAARALRISLRGLQYKLKRYVEEDGIERVLPPDRARGIAS